MLRDNVALVLFKRPIIALDSQMIKEVNSMIDIYNEIKELEEL